MKILTSLRTCNHLLIMLILILFFSQTVWAQQEKDGIEKKAGASNLHVISDEMIAEQGQSMVEFIGNVRATREDAVLMADSVKVYFHTSETKKDAQSNVKQIIATGNVEYTAGDRKAYADKAVYTTGEEVLVLTGDAPKLLTGKSWITGKKITLYKLEERVIVQSGSQKRVQAFFDSQDQNQPIEKP